MCHHGCWTCTHTHKYSQLTHLLASHSVVPLFAAVGQILSFSFLAKSLHRSHQWCWMLLFWIILTQLSYVQSRQELGRVFRRPSVAKVLPLCWRIFRVRPGWFVSIVYFSVVERASNQGNHPCQPQFDHTSEFSDTVPFNFLWILFITLHHMDC